MAHTKEVVGTMGQPTMGGIGQEVASTLMRTPTISSRLSPRVDFLPYHIPTTRIVQEVFLHIGNDYHTMARTQEEGSKMALAQNAYRLFKNITVYYYDLLNMAHTCNEGSAKSSLCILMTMIVPLLRHIPTTGDYK